MNYPALRDMFSKYDITREHEFVWSRGICDQIQGMRNKSCADVHNELVFLARDWSNTRWGERNADNTYPVKSEKTDLPPNIQYRLVYNGSIRVVSYLLNRIVPWRRDYINNRKQFWLFVYDSAMNK